MTSFKKYFNTYNTDLANKINCKQHSKAIITAVTTLFDSLELCFSKCYKDNIFEALFEYCKLEYESHGNTDPMLLKYYFVASVGSLEIITQFALYNANCVIDLMQIKTVESEYYPLMRIDNALFNNCINCITMPVFQNKLNVLKNCINCKFCMDCSDCIDCFDCVNCSKMIKCSNCKNSEKCSQCTYCYDCQSCYKSKKLTRCSNCFNCNYCKTSNELIHANKSVGCKYAMFIENCANCNNCSRISDKDSVKNFIGHIKVNSSIINRDLQDDSREDMLMNNTEYYNAQYQQQYSTGLTTNYATKDIDEAMANKYPYVQYNTMMKNNDENIANKYPYIQYAQASECVNTCSQVQNTNYCYNQYYQSNNSSQPMSTSMKNMYYCTDDLTNKTSLNNQSTYPPPCYGMSEQSQIHQPIQTTLKRQVKCSTSEARDRDRNFIKFRNS